MEISDITRQDEIDPLEPFWLNNVDKDGKFLKNKKKVLEWFEHTFPIIEEYYKPDILEQLNNIHWYLGEYDRTQEYTMVPQSGGSDRNQISRRMLPVIFSHLTDLTEQRVSRMSRFKPSFRMMPTNNERDDIDNARIMELIIKNIKRRNNDEILFVDLERWNAVCGHVYMGIEWDESIGDRTSPNSHKREGDVSMKLIPSWRVFPWPKMQWDDVPCTIDIYEILDIEEARKKYNKPKLEADGKGQIYSFEESSAKSKDPNEVVVYRICYKPDRYCTSGAYIFLTSSEILKIEGEYPYSHEDFPFERYTDVDVPGRLMPVSMYQFIKPMQHQYNKMTSMISRNIAMLAHPKIMMPSGACKTSSWANTPLFVEYNSQVAPHVVNFQTTNPEVFVYRDGIKGEMEQIYGIQGVSRGTPPPGTRSGVQLLFFEEQEQQRASTQIIKRNEFIRRSLRKVGSVAADYYPNSSKERLIREVGQENQHMLVALDELNLSKTYDVELQNSTAFSDSKAGRISQILDIVQTDPELLSREEKMDLLELGNSSKIYDIHTSALRQAEWENQQIREGRDAGDPKPYQDLLVHWRAHVIELQSTQFETQASVESKERLFEHIEVTEGLMEEQALENAAFAARLITLEHYPTFYALSPEGQALLNPMRAQLEQEAAMNESGAGALPPQPLVDELEPEALPPEELVQGEVLPTEEDLPVI